MTLQDLHRFCFFVTDFEEDGTAIKVKCANTYNQWRKVVPAQSNSALRKEEFAAFVTRRYVDNRTAELRRHLRLSGFTEITIDWNPVHLGRKA